MFLGLLIISLVVILGVLSHRRTRLEQKVFKDVPLCDWLTLLVWPLAWYIGWFLLIKNIISRPPVDIIPFDDLDILAIVVMLMVYAMIGNAIHFSGKTLWRYLNGQKNTTAYRVTEMFHGKLGHYISYVSILFIIYFLFIIEINHPITEPIPFFSFTFIVIFGGLFGVFASKTIFFINQWFGGYNKPLFFISVILFGLLLGFMKINKLSFLYYPVTLFLTAVFISGIIAFITRQIIIFGKLNKKKRLRFLAKILSV